MYACDVLADSPIPLSSRDLIPGPIGLFVQPIVEIKPFRVIFFYQLNLPGALPLLESFFTLNGTRNIVMRFYKNQAGCSVFFGKFRTQSLPMFPNPAANIAGDANV